VWPSNDCEELEATPSLLTATALVASSPDPNTMFVFGVGRTLQLRYARWDDAVQAWSPLANLGLPTDQLSPHTRLAAHSYDGCVEVAAVSHDGTLRIYDIVLAGTTWTPGAPVVVANPSPAAPAGLVPPAAQLPAEPAYGWSINPYGELAITREGTVTVVYAAGAAPGRTGVLRREIVTTGIWELLR
jgi:hypothetical protein